MRIIKVKNVDSSTFIEAYSSILKLVSAGSEKFCNVLDDKVEEKLDCVIILPYESNEFDVNKDTPGMTETEFVGPENMLGTKDLLVNAHINIYDENDNKDSDKNKILYIEGHEIVHLISSIIPGLIKGVNNAIKKDDNIYFNALGYYGKFNEDEMTKYGVMFCETLSDMIAITALNTYSPSYINKTDPNTILRKNYNNWKRDNSGYSFFCSLTRLAIAAFSNDPDADFNKMISKEQNIFFTRRKCRNNKYLFNNDILYSFIADPMHIKREFEKIEGENQYDVLAGSIDIAFDNCLKKGSMNKKVIKLYMKVLTSYFNNKLNKYYEEGYYNKEDVNKLQNNFDGVWDEVKKEYGIYFSKLEMIELKNNFKKSLKKQFFLF